LSDTVVCISCHALEEPYAVETTIRSALSMGYDVIVGYDLRIPDNHRDILNKYKVTIAVSGEEGIGNNRNMLAHMAVELGYRMFIQSDCHVMFIPWSGKPVGNNVFLMFPVVEKQLLVADKLVDSAFMYIGTVHGYDDIRKIRFIGKESKYVYFFGEPVFSIETSILRRIADIQSGYIYLLPGYGYEVADVMLTAARMGYVFMKSDAFIYAHRINKGKEERWRERWTREQMLMFHANMYIYSVKHGFRTPVYYKELEERFKERIEIAKRVNEELSIPTKKIFELMKNATKRGYIVLF